MKHKVLALDLDGTLINSKNEIIGGGKTLKYLSYLSNQGFEIVISTGRLDHDIQNIAEKYDIKLSARISQNGAVLHTDDQVIGKKLPITSSLKLYNYLKTCNVRFELNTVSNRYWLTERDDAFPKELYPSNIIVDDYTEIIINQPIILFLVIGESEEIEIIREYVQKNFQDVYAVSTSETSLEILQRGISKGSTLKQLYRNSEIYAIGDSENDYSMFTVPERSFLIGDQEIPKATRVNNIVEALEKIVEVVE